MHIFPSHQNRRFSEYYSKFELLVGTNELHWFILISILDAPKLIFHDQTQNQTSFYLRVKRVLDKEIADSVTFRLEKGIRKYCGDRKIVLQAHTLSIQTTVFAVKYWKMLKWRSIRAEIFVGTKLRKSYHSSAFP